MLLLACCPNPASAQVFCGEHKFDGTHKNEIEGYIQGGKNEIAGGFAGPVVSYKHHFTDRWFVSGSFQTLFGKQMYGLATQGGYRLPAIYFNFYFMGKVMYNRYQKYNTNEWNLNVSVLWEAPYFEIMLGETFVRYIMSNSGYSERHTPVFGIGANIRPRWNSWNIGLFFRNYDDFYFENWNINWGLRFNANLPASMKLFGELNIRPAGSISQLATKYETSLKLGLKYAW